ncbi:MAG: cupin domain-containing protein [Actinomycetota bacterium]
MQKVSIEALARQQLERAASSGRNAADTVVGGHERILRQTVVGMTAGSQMSEHENPGEATIYVLKGAVRMTADEQQWDGRTGDLLLIPDSRHSLLALEDAAILLTVAKRP